ncbi:MAG: PAS domain S-box protein [Nitrospirales bacterium]|nr:MAG: PAS domain S-box protein [Nitrospirales bacterium]
MNPHHPFQELHQMDLPSLNQALRSAQAFVHTLLDSIHIGICQVNTHGQILSLNLEGARLLHRTEQSCLGQPFHEHSGCLYVDPITQEEDCPIAQVLKTGKSIWTPKLLIRRPSGETRWVEFQCTQLTDPHNPGALLIFRDLSQQLQQHEEHQHLASMPEESPNPIVEVDPQGRLAYANPAMIALLDSYGFREDGVPQVLPPALTHITRECLKSLVPQRGLTVIIETHHFDWTFSPIQEKGLVRGYGLDITNHVRVRNRLTELQSQYSSLVDSAHEGIISADLHGTIVSWNPAAESIFNFQPEEVIGKSILSLLTEGYRDIYRKGLEDISYGESVAHPIQKPLELTGLRKSGEAFPLEISLTSWKVGLDTHYGFILRDISDRKRLEQSLVDEKERLVTTLQSLDEGIITTDREGRITFFNPLAEQITEWAHQDALNRPLQEVFRITNEASPHQDETALQFSPASSALTEHDSPLHLITKHGLQRAISMREAPIRDHSSHLMGTVIVFHDVTDRHRHQDEQQRISKLNSLGVLAGGLAHDFNNLLTTILGNVFVAKLRMIPQDPLTHNLEQAEQACLRAKELTQQLLTFAKGGAPIKTSIALGDLLRKSVIFALSGSSISCHFDIPNDLWPLDADTSQLRQVIQNMTINARQAMPQGGHFSIRVENTALPTSSTLPSPTLATGNYIKISFEDQGTGIKDQELPNIFDPYFTTKPGASGLGLATAHSIIQQHLGHISVHSTIGKGTTFTVYLPSSYSSVRLDRQTIPKGRGRILVMDDEQSIRRMVEDALTQFGYEVTAAEDGQTAIDLFSAALTSGKTFDAILLDLTIPGGMGGKEAIQHLRRLDPHVKAVVTSGYSDDPIMSDFQAYGFQDILVKPYKISDLAKTLESLCAQSHGKTVG